jgi:septal ring factor EnvC (AmiA/AmiB activator)
MSDAAMPLSNQDLEQIKQHLSHWMDNKIQSGPWAIGPELLERAVRVEEELKHQRLLMRESFEQFEKRFEQFEKRFEQVDKRFEQVDKRFEQVDKRFEQVDKRFEQIERHFDQVDKRFEQVDKRLDLQQQEIRLIARKQDHLLWSIAAGMAGLFTSQIVLFT